MNKSEQYQQDIGNHFKACKSKPPCDGIDHPASVFISDGIVCPGQWFSQKVRPLFLLKEAYHGSGDWDLIAQHLMTRDRMKKSIWRRVSEWTYGLTGTTKDAILPFPDDEALQYFGNPWLCQAAVVNVKKSGGTSHSDMTLINHYASCDRKELLRELELIDPTVIVCGYTISSLNIIMGETIKDYQHPNPNLYYQTTLNGHGVIVLDYYHPSNRYPAVMNYYGLVGAYQQALIHGGIENRKSF